MYAWLLETMLWVLSSMLHCVSGGQTVMEMLEMEGMPGDCALHDELMYRTHLAVCCKRDCIHLLCLCRSTEYSSMC